MGATSSKSNYFLLFTIMTSLITKILYLLSEGCEVKIMLHTNYIFIMKYAVLILAEDTDDEDMTTGK